MSAKKTQTEAGKDASSITLSFMSNHAHVVLCIAQNCDIRLREVAMRVGITERAVQRIVADLEAAGYLSRIRTGRRNRYQLHVNRPLKHPLEAHHKLSDLLRLANHLPGSLGFLAAGGDGADGTPTRRSRRR